MEGKKPRYDNNPRVYTKLKTRPSYLVFFTGARLHLAKTCFFSSSVLKVIYLAEQSELTILMSKI